MIYPTLYIDQNNNETLINIFDADFDDEEPVLSIKGEEEIFITLLKLFLNQYAMGFDDGYLACFDENELDSDSN